MPNKGIHQLMMYEEKQLLIHSAVINDHPKLTPVLEHFDKIFYTDIENHKFKEYLTDDMINFFKYGFDTLIDEAQNEWCQAPSYDVVKQGTVSCELCGNNQLVHIYKIRNEKTQKELRVGSDCIEKFPSIYKSTETSVSLSKKRKDATAIRRQVDINTKIPNIGERISKWYSSINENPIVLPKELEDSIRTLLDKARALYEGYINSKPNHGETVIKTIQDMIPKIEELFNVINLHNENNTHQPYVCDGDLRRWIDKEHGNNSNVLDIIKSNGGYISNESIKFIYEPNFVKLQIALVEDSLKSNYLFYLDNNDGNLCFEYTRHEPYKFVLTCSPSIFMNNCSVLNDSVFSTDIEKLYGILKINDTIKDDDYYSPIAFCDSLLISNKSAYRISYNNTGAEKLLVKKMPNYKRNKNEKAMFSKIDLKYLYKELESVIFTQDIQKIHSRIVKNFDNYRNWQTHEQIKDYNVDEKLIAGEHYIYRRPRR